MNIRALLSFTILLSVIGGHANATTYAMPENTQDSVITQYPDGIPLAHTDEDETLLDVARRFLLGQTEIVRLNPDIDRWLVKKGEIVRLSNKRILPDSPHDGITLNISEYRMYYYPPTKKGEAPKQVMSYAHGVGRQDWKTPLGKTRITRKIMNPSWHPPESIRREHAANGDPLPVVVAPGPNNPLGTRALHLALPGEYRIHGTDVDKIHGIGMQITHGCVRMYPKDVEELYDMVAVGTPVYIVKQPIKVGWLDNVLYVEAHPDLEGEETTLEQRFAVALGLIEKAGNLARDDVYAGSQSVTEMPGFDQKALNRALTNQAGEPIAIYERLPLLENADAGVQTEEAPQAAPKPARQPSPTGYYRGD
ncbi:MAG: L,D-transpeptidase family protein [Methylobacter sp.]|uniref:L,D-transpeptidase family protein n=1 Tax=Candidatus Methylobacter titanis TaxID=3053457 RepID=A0AA43Q5G9_9GAMM|nr:L,D-transpeptidase family protein [Candidatus Methylobacter titanis]MDI1292431.1 L,D-transpeptidase family protein [Candidatus Methylobacter titanis]